MRSRVSKSSSSRRAPTSDARVVASAPPWFVEAGHLTRPCGNSTHPRPRRRPSPERVYGQDMEHFATETHVVVRRQTKNRLEINAFPKTSVIILVHGAWADGLRRNNVILPLQRHGLKIICAPIPLTSLTDDTLRRRALERTSCLVRGGARLCGAVIGAAHEPRVTPLVFVAAPAPTRAKPYARRLDRGAPIDVPQLIPDPHGLRCHGCPKKGFAVAVAESVRSSNGANHGRIRNDLLRFSASRRRPGCRIEKRSHRGSCLQKDDRMINPKTQRFMAHRMG